MCRLQPSGFSKSTTRSKAPTIPTVPTSCRLPQHACFPNVPRCRLSFPWWGDDCLSDHLSRPWGKHVPRYPHETMHPEPMHSTALLSTYSSPRLLTIVQACYLPSACRHAWFAAAVVPTVASMPHLVGDLQNFVVRPKPTVRYDVPPASAFLLPPKFLRRGTRHLSR